MKNLKEIIIGIFAVIGVLALVTGFANNTETATQQVSYGTPESHVWSFHIVAEGGVRGFTHPFALNKVTGEVRKYSIAAVNLSKKPYIRYKVAKDIRDIEELKK